MLLCVHGCKSLIHESVELAERKTLAWLSLPCCLQLENHLDERTSLKVADGTRCAMLCGAIAAKYTKAETMTTIDSRISARGIVLASSGKRHTRVVKNKWYQRFVFVSDEFDYMTPYVGCTHHLLRGRYPIAPHRPPR